MIVNVIDGQTVLDRRLETMGSPRTPGLVVPCHMPAELAVPGTRLVAGHVVDPAVAIVPARAEIEHMTYRMAWHPRLDDDPAQRWLRDTVRPITAGIAA